MDIGWHHVWGLGAIALGIYWIVRRDVPVGVEGRSPAFHARGRWAVVLGAGAILVGLLMALQILGAGSK
jgi:hypothetical protein